MAAAASSTFAFILILLAAVTPHSRAAWCVCKDGLSDGVYQKALDYACGAGADCNPIHQAGSCYNPNSVKAHCSYAVNSYYQRKASSGATCDFTGAAALVSSDPSVSGCSFPASSSAAGTTTTPSSSTTTPSSSTRTPSTTLPYSTTPTGTGLTGLGPSGTGSNTDFSKASPLALNTVFVGCLISTAGLVLQFWH